MNKKMNCVVYMMVSLVGWGLYFNLLFHPKDPMLSPDITKTLTSSVVWYHSRGKLQELRHILLNETRNKPRKEVEDQIKNLLKHRTSAYIRQFNQYNTPISNLGDWYQKNFDFENFLNEIFVVVFEPYDYKTNQERRLIVESKIQRIRDIMEKYQNETDGKMNDYFLSKS